MNGNRTFGAYMHMLILPLQNRQISAILSQKTFGVNIDITSSKDYTVSGINLKITRWGYIT